MGGITLDSESDISVLSLKLIYQLPTRLQRKIQMTNNNEFEMTDEEMIVSMGLSMSLTIQIAELLRNDTPINSIIHTMAVGLSGVICEKHQMMGDDCKKITIQVIKYATRLIQQNQKSSLPRPSDN